MNNAVGVEMLQCIDNLHCVALNFKFMESLSSFEEFVQALIMAELQQNVHTLRVLKKVHELSYICVLDRPVDFNFTHQLLLSPASSERSFQDDFCGSNLLRFTLHKLVALCESTLAEELPFDVLSIADLTIRVLNSFFNNLSRLTGLLRVKVCLAVAVLRSCDERLVGSSCPSRVSSIIWL